MPDEMKHCPSCDKDLPIDSYYVVKQHYRHTCKQCINTYNTKKTKDRKMKKAIQKSTELSGKLSAALETANPPSTRA